MRGGSNEYKKGLWTVEEDKILTEYVKAHGEGRWNRIPQATGLKRCRKSCRLRWVNYLCPDVKHGDFSSEEEDLIVRLHNLLGNRWSLIAGRVPGRTDNQVKNHWNTHLSKKLGLEGPRCRDNAPTTATTSAASGHLKHSKDRLTASSYPEPSSDEKAAELDDASSRSTGPASRRGEAGANVGPSTSVRFLDDELGPAYAANIMESLCDFEFDFILYGR